MLDLAKNFPAMWIDPRTPQRERKRIFRLLVEDVTLIKRDNITVHVRFRGGTIRTLFLPLPLTMAQIRKIKSNIVKEIDSLLGENYSYSEIAENLNRQGHHTWEDKPFTAKKVAWIRHDYRLKSPYQRLRDKAFLTVKEMAEKLEISPSTVHAWRQQGFLRCQRYSDRRPFSLYDPPDYIRITKGLGGLPPTIESVTTTLNSE
jgi:DNA-binding transcriptional regulator YiaG